MSLRARVGAFFLEAGDPPPGDPPVPPAPGAPPVPPALGARPPLRPPDASPPLHTPGAPPPLHALGAPPASVAGTCCVAAVLGPSAAVVPVAAACAGELRARLRTPAALVCVWRPIGPVAAPPAGAATPGARRLAQRLTERGAAATACGRLAWLALETDPAAAAATARRAILAAGQPAVVAIAGPRPAELEAMLATAELAVVVLPAHADPAVGALALAGLPAPARVTHPPLAAGPARWAALAGLARLRTLPELGPR
jgi:hypothetical protein